MTVEEAEKKVHSIFLNYLPFGGDKEADEVIKVLEQESDFDKDCEHCSKTRGTLGCCDAVSNKWVYSCKDGQREYILDKIKAEIEALPKTYPFVNHIDTYVKEDDVRRIIDKYKAGSENDLYREESI